MLLILRLCIQTGHHFFCIFKFILNIYFFILQKFEGSDLYKKTSLIQDEIYLLIDLLSTNVPNEIWRCLRIFSDILDCVKKPNTYISLIDDEELYIVKWNHFYAQFKTLKYQVLTIDAFNKSL